MRTASSSSRLLVGGKLSASVHAGIPPRCEPGDPRVWAGYPPKCGRGDPPRCGPRDPPPGQTPELPLGCGPGDLQGILRYHPPRDLQGMLGYHLQCMLEYHPPPCEQNS